MKCTMHAASLEHHPIHKRIDIPEWDAAEKPEMIISTINAGDMTISEGRGKRNRSSFFEMLGISAHRVVALRQVHSRKVHTIEEIGKDDFPAGDGLITTDPSIILSVTVADCVPIYLFNKTGTVFGLLHSGWKGTGIAHEALGIFKRTFGVATKEISAVIGPSIGPCCYSVDPQREEYFTQTWGEETVDVRDGVPYLDLPAANALILKKAGVKHIAAVPVCTCCSESFGSYRREGSDRFTKMVALMGHFK